MEIKIASEQDLVALFARHLHISVNMRHWQTRWAEEHGYNNLNQKKFWEKRMDDFLNDLNANYGGKGNEKRIKINVEKND